MNPPLPRHPRLDEMLSLYDQGLSYRQIGEQVGISHETVRNHVRRHRDTAPTPPLSEDGVSCWMTIDEAAEALGVQQCTVRSRIRRGVIEVRRVDRHRFVRVYDSQWVDGQGLPPHVHKMVELRAQGFSYEAIGRDLGVSTTTVEWHLTRRGIDMRPERVIPPRVQQMADLRAQGLSYREIGAEVGIRDTTVTRLLARWGLYLPVGKRK